MGQAFFHSPSGGADFLGVRRASNGRTEIVYDDGVARRIVWRVEGQPAAGLLTDALRVAVGSLRVVPTLHEELKKRAILVEQVIA